MTMLQKLGLFCRYHSRIVDRVTFQCSLNILPVRSHLNLLVNRHRLGSIEYFHYVPKPTKRVNDSTRSSKYSINERKKYKGDLGMTKMASLMEDHAGKSNLTDEEWTKLKSTSVEMKVDPVTLDALLMQHFRERKCYPLGRSFLQFVKKNGKPNLLTLSHYIALCGECIDQSSEEEILSVLDEIPTDALCAELIAKCAVLGLVKTSQWTRSFDIVKNSNSNKIMGDILAAAAFRNNDFETAWKLLEELFKSDVKACRSLEECVDATNRMGSQRDVENLLTKLLMFCRNNHIIISYLCAQKLKQVFKSRFSMKGNIVNTKTNVCSSCGTELERNGLTSVELLNLQNAFKSKVVIGSDVFLHSTPGEVDRFFKFIESGKSYDLVVDGLNAAYNMNDLKANVSMYSAQLRDVLEYFARSELNRILVIGRKHMSTRWPRKVMADIEKLATCFYAENISEDDPFLLYAALFLGPNTYFLSNDTFKDHRFKLDDDNLRRIFDRWRSSRQILFPARVHGKPVFQLPLKHSIRVQGSFKRGWHVPFLHEGDKELGPYDYCKHWLCVDNK